GARGAAGACLVGSPAGAGARGWRAVRVVAGDLDARAARRQACAGADVIFHVAGRISAGRPDEFLRANRDGTANVLEAASRDPPRRFVLVSSLAAAGPTVRGQPLDASRPPPPVTAYGARQTGRAGPGG